MLTWIKKNKYCLETIILLGGRYRVSKTLDGDVPKYMPWHGDKLIGRPQSTADNAKAICELHYMEGLK